MLSTRRTLSIASRAIRNRIVGRPVCVSFEVTHCCNAKCKHCHLGGQVRETRATPEELGRRCAEIGPVIAQLSGGEPLLRKDIEDIVRAFRRPDRAPYIDITTNGILLTAERYHRLLRAGVDQVGISLEYPDERHDGFRGVPGLFRRIERLVTGVRQGEKPAITLLCTIHRGNFRELVRMAELALDWNVNLNFSTYTWLRTNDMSYLLEPGEMDELRALGPRLMAMRKRHDHIFTSPYVFNRIVRFFENRSAPDCRTGYTFLNVNPDGTLSPCGLIIKNYRSRRELRDKFSRNNTCTACYTSIRANTEKPMVHKLTDTLGIVGRL